MRPPRSIPQAWGFAEVAVFVSAYFAAVWLIAPRVAEAWAAISIVGLTTGAVVLIGWLSPTVLHGDPPALRGWGRVTPPQRGAARVAWPLYAALTAGGIAVTAVLALLIRGPEGIQHIAWDGLPWRLARYLVFAQIQAMMVFGFILTRLRTALGAFVVPGFGLQGLTCLLTASIFCSLHLPNWPLVGLTFAVGLVWAWAFYTYPSILLVGISHAVLGAATQVILGLSTRIGPFYAHPDQYVFRALIPGLTELIGGRF